MIEKRLRIEKPRPIQRVLTYVKDVWGIDPIVFMNYSVLFMWIFVKKFGKEKFEELVKYIETNPNDEAILYAFYNILATKFSNTVLIESVNSIIDDIKQVKDNVTKINENVNSIVEKVEELSGFLEILMSLDQKISKMLQSIEQKLDEKKLNPQSCGFNSK